MMYGCPLRRATKRAGLLLGCEARLSTVLPCASLMPLLRYILLRPLPPVPSLASGLVPGMAARILVPPLWDVAHCDGFLRKRGAGLLHPVTGHGVRWVSTGPFVAVLRQRRRGMAFPPALYPSKVCSSSAAVPGRPGRSLLTVLSSHTPLALRAWTVANPSCRSRGCPLLRVLGHREDIDESALGHFLPRSLYEPR
jgi:hypothetical protein